MPGTKINASNAQRLIRVPCFPSRATIPTPERSLCGGGVAGGETTIAGMRSLIALILNIIWFITAGLWLWLGYILAGLVACIFIVTIPFGVASFRIAGFVLWPFGREVVDKGAPTGAGTIGNIIWFVVAGLWLAVGHIITAVAQGVTIIGLPLAWANLKLIPVTCFPFGKEVVASSDGNASMVPVARR